MRNVTTSEPDAKGWVTVLCTDVHPSGTPLNLSFNWPSKDTGLEAYKDSARTLEKSMDHLMGQSIEDVRRDSPWAIPRTTAKPTQMSAADLGLAPDGKIAV